MYCQSEHKIFHFFFMYFDHLDVTAFNIYDWELLMSHWLSFWAFTARAHVQSLV